MSLSELCQQPLRPLQLGQAAEGLQVFAVGVGKEGPLAVPMLRGRIRQCRAEEERIDDEILAVDN